MIDKLATFALASLSFVESAASSPAEQPPKSPWSASAAITLGEAYWTRPGFFPIDKSGPVVQPEANISHTSKIGKLSVYAWLNQNLSSGLRIEGAHELDIGISYNSHSLIQKENFKAGVILHSAWWEYGLAGKLGESHSIVEGGIWMNQKVNEKVSLEGKASWMQLFGKKGSDGVMLSTSVSLPYQISKKCSVTPTFSWTYLTGEDFYGSKEGTAHVRAVIPLSYCFGKGYSATLGFRTQAGFNGKDDNIGSFLKLQKDF
ncbi:MAG: hypothetical protein AABY00_02190 [Nanoarchaeota archaeon]